MQGSLSTSNKHQLSVELADQRGEHERLEETLADALEAARRVLGALREIGHEPGKRTDWAIGKLGDLVEKGRPLDELFRVELGVIGDHLAQSELPSERDQTRRAIAADVARAMRLSQRVADYLAAEREIGWHRGQRL
jgi:hypothetical protein